MVVRACRLISVYQMRPIPFLLVLIEAFCQRFHFTSPESNTLVVDFLHFYLVPIEQRFQCASVTNMQYLHCFVIVDETLFGIVAFDLGNDGFKHVRHCFFAAFVPVYSVDSILQHFLGIL